MLQRLYKGRYAFAIIALVIMCFGFATPAMADPETQYQNITDVKLTAVIVAPVGTNAEGDDYVFQFAGGGKVTGDTDERGFLHVFSGGIEQDATTIRVDDVVPTIGDVTLDGIELTDANSLTNATQNLGQTVVQKPLSEILSGITFPHAGVYTYEVTEKSATSSPSKAYVAASQAKYLLRIYVKNAYTGNNSQSGNMDLVIDYVTIERKKDDDGADAIKEDGSSYKVNPTSPTTDASGKITGIGANQLAGDANGRNVPGFTFANAYTTIAPFQVKKLYDGDHTDRTKYSTVELAVHSSAMMGSNVEGGVLTYKIVGGKDLIQGRSTLDGVEGIDQVEDYMAEYDAYGWCYITAGLHEGDSIQITGEFGPLDGQNHREILSTNGLFQRQIYYVVERGVGDYRPEGYTYVSNNPSESVDPRKSTDASGMTKTEGLKDPTTIDDGKIVYPELKQSAIYNNDLGQFDLFLPSKTTGSATTIFVVNHIDETKVSTTGILIDNLPYILMIGIPVIVFIALFVLKRRRNAVE